MAEIMLPTLNIGELHNATIDKFEELRKEIDFVNKQFNKQQRAWKKYKWIKYKKSW